MSTFNFSDITPAGSFMNAFSTALESDRRDANRHFETNEGPSILTRFAANLRQLAVKSTEKCLAATLTSRPV